MARKDERLTELSKAAIGFGRHVVAIPVAAFYSKGENMEYKVNPNLLIRKSSFDDTFYIFTREFHLKNEQEKIYVSEVIAKTINKKKNKFIDTKYLINSGICNSEQVDKVIKLFKESRIFI